MTAMLLKYLLKKPLVLAAYIILIVLVPNLVVRMTYQTAMLIEGVRRLETEQFISILVQVVGCFLLFFLCHYGLKLCQVSIISEARISVKSELFHEVTGISRDRFSGQSCGEYITTFSNDVSLLEYRYFTAVLDFADALISFVTYFAAILTLNRVFALIVFACEIMGLTICLIFRKKNIRLSSQYVRQLGIFTQRVREFFAARMAIHNYHALDPVRAVFRKTNQETEDAKTDMEISLAFTDSFAHFTRCMGAYTIVAVGAVLMMRDLVSFSDIFVAYTFANTLSAPIKRIINDINAVNSMQSIKTKMEMLISHNQEEKALTGSCGSFSGIRMEHVTVQYDQLTAVADVSFHFEAGKKYLILGRNGCGKSSLMKLLVRGNDRYQGSITMCGREMRELPNEVVREHVSLISEDVSLLTDTVGNNIGLYRNVSDEEIRQAALFTGLRIPLERCLHDRGRNISSGERRRIEISRTLIWQPDVLIIDEAFSTLDIPTAYELEKKLLMVQNKTVIVISHNFAGSLLESYDCIIMMEHGGIQASGSHKQLLAECEAYRHLIELKCGRMQ